MTEQYGDMDLVVEVQIKGRRALDLRRNQSRRDYLRTYQSDLEKALNALGLPFPDEYLANREDDSIECVYKHDRLDTKLCDMFNIGIHNARRSQRYLDRLEISSVSLRGAGSPRLLDSSSWTSRPDPIKPVQLLGRPSDRPSITRTNQSSTPSEKPQSRFIDITASDRPHNSMDGSQNAHDVSEEDHSLDVLEAKRRELSATRRVISFLEVREDLIMHQLGITAEFHKAPNPSSLATRSADALLRRTTTYIRQKSYEELHNLYRQLDTLHGDNYKLRQELEYEQDHNHQIERIIENLKQGQLKDYIIIAAQVKEALGRLSR